MVPGVHRPPATDNEPAAKKARTTPTVVGWFRNDLRLSDNPMLEEVLKRSEERKLPSMLVYILDPRFYDASQYGRVTDQTRPARSAMIRGDAFVSRKCNGRRARFTLNVVRDLQRGLKEVGTELYIFYGHPEDVFYGLSMQHGALEVVALREPVSPEWTDVEKYVSSTVQKNGGSLTTLWGAMSLYHEDDISFSFKEAPSSYTSLANNLGWKDIWTSLDQNWWATQIRKPIPMLKGPWTLEKAAAPQGAWPQEIIDDDREAMTRLGFSTEEIEETLKAPHGGSRKGKGGETAARARFEAFLATKAEPVKTDPKFVCLGGEYGAAGAKFVEEGKIDPFQWRNLSTSAGWMALSKYMAIGCISPREMYHTMLDKEHWALPGVVHRFMWREWHRNNAIKYQAKLFRLQGPGGQYQMSRVGNSDLGQRWKEGNTGVPYIDACMRELNKTGWIPYHKRKTVACFLCHDLAVDWRFGAFHFEEVLLDYDVAMNYGNWTFCARVDKGYNDRYCADGWRDREHNCSWKSIQVNAANDPNGEYIRAWCRELEKVPTEYVQCPWMMSAEDQKKSGCVIGNDYPAPLVTFPQIETAPQHSGCLSTVTNSTVFKVLERFLKFPAFGSVFLLIAWLAGTLNNPNNIAKQLCIVCSHNIAIGYYFDRDTKGILVGFPHFGPMSGDVPVLRILARFWSYEMVAIRFATALRPYFLPGLFASFMSLIIPQMAVFAPWQLGGIVSSDYFKNPISFASVNGFPALNWLIWFLVWGLIALPLKSFADLSILWVDIPGKLTNFDYVGLALGLMPFVITLCYKILSVMFREIPTPWGRQWLWAPSQFSGKGRTFFSLSCCFSPCICYLLYNGWAIEDAHKVLYACVSFMPIWWVNCLGGVDLWIEQPLGVPARKIAFTPTWIVSHGVYMLQWALDPSDYINRLCFILYYFPQMIYLNFYFRNACPKDWGTQLPIYYSYLMNAHMLIMELYKFGLDIQSVGMQAIYNEVVKDCPLHFTTAQATALAILVTAVFTCGNAKIRWALYSSCGPLNWMGII